MLGYLTHFLMGQSSFGNIKRTYSLLDSHKVMADSCSLWPEARTDFKIERVIVGFPRLNSGQKVIP